VFLDESNVAVVDAFLSYLERVGRAAGTRDVYSRAVSNLLAVSGAKQLTALTTAEIDAYLATWRKEFRRTHGRPPSPSTYRNRVNAIRALYAWMERFDLLRDARGMLLPNPRRALDAPRVDRRANDWLRSAEDRALLSAPIPDHERFIVMLLRWSGLRVGEAVSLTWSDIDLTPDAETIVVRQSKTPAGRRSIPILPPLLSELRTRDSIGGSRDGGSPLLITRYGTAMKPSYVWRVVNRAAYRAGIRVVPCICASAATMHAKTCPRTSSGEHLSRVSPHTLRRTFGSHLLNRGVSLEVVSRLLGHASTSVTEKAYAELLYETTRREVLRALQGEGWAVIR
jgi:integrase